jgi:hypothetical protein
MLTLIVLDKNGDTLVTEDVQNEFDRLCKLGYAAFANPSADPSADSIQVTELPAEGNILMLAPLAGG